MPDLDEISRIFARLVRADRRDVWIKFVPVEVFPLLNSELYCFHVFEFGDNSEPIHTSGSMEHPFTYGIRETLGDSAQAHAAFTMTLELLHRLYGPTSEHTEIQAATQVITPSEDSVLSANAEADRIYRRISVFNDTAELAILLAEFNVNVHLLIGENVRSDGSDWRKSASFLLWAYNNRPGVRNIIDRITYGTIGGGFSLSSPHEAARRFLERQLAGMQITRITAQSIRDAHLFGTSCIIFSASSGLSIRLIRPTALDISGTGNMIRISDLDSGETWPLESDHVALIPGISQRSSHFGLSVLEPALTTLVTIYRLSSIISEIINKSEDAHYTFVQRSEGLLKLADSHIQAAERRLGTLFSFPIESLPLDRTDLYLPGWERFD